MPNFVGETVRPVDASCFERLTARRHSAARKAFSVRRVDFDDAACLVHNKAPVSGDLVMAEVTSIGHHRFLEDAHGRRCTLYVGDTIIVAFGARYAPDQFDGVVPASLAPCHLLAGGGIAGEVVARHSATRPPTSIRPLGLLADREGVVINLRRYRIEGAAAKLSGPSTIVVAGTSMNAGKTRTASCLIRGLTKAGLRVGAAKLTGTGSGGDVWSMVDAGASRVLDFTDAGFSTTHQADGHSLTLAACSLLDHLSRDHEITVAEIADGLLQHETALLLQSLELRQRTHAIIFAASDSLGAVAGVRWLRERDLPVIALSGLITASPLGSAEAECATGLATYTCEELSDAELAPKLCFSADEGVRSALRRCV